MAFWDAFLVFLHVFSAIWTVSGGIGRELSRRQAEKTVELPIFLAISSLSGRFEDLMVRPGSMGLAVTGIALAFIQGWPLLGILQGSPVNWLLVCNLLVITIVLLIVFFFVPSGRRFERILREAVQSGEITPDLRAAWQDPAVRAAHIYEGAAILVIIFLMIAKPF